MPVGRDHRYAIGRRALLWMRVGSLARASARVRSTPGVGDRGCRADGGRRSGPVTRPACASRFSACEIDGRSAATSWPSRRCVSGSDSRTPVGSTRPQRSARCHRSRTRRTSSRGCEVIARSTSSSRGRRQARRARIRRICGNGRTRSAKSPSSTASLVGRSARHPDVRTSIWSGAGPSGWSRSPGPTSSAAVRSADPDLEREQAVEDQQAEALARGLEPGRQVARADCDLEDPRGRELARGDPCRARRTRRRALRRRRAGTCRARSSPGRHRPAADGGAIAGAQAGQPLGLRRTRHSLSVVLSTLSTHRPVYAPRIVGHTTSDVAW